MSIEKFLSEIENREKHTKSKIVVGYLKEEIIKFLDENNIEIHTKEIYLTHKGLAHLSRESKRKRGAGLSRDDIIKIPQILENPTNIFFDSRKEKLNLLYCDKKSCEVMMKLVIDTKSIEKSEKLTLIKTAGYVKWYNIEKDRYYKEVERPSPSHTSPC